MFIALNEVKRNVQSERCGGKTNGIYGEKEWREGKANVTANRCSENLG